MSLSILDVLHNAEFNLLGNATQIQKLIGIIQLKNAIKQLEVNPDASAGFKEDDNDDEEG